MNNKLKSMLAVALASMTSMMAMGQSATFNQPTGLYRLKSLRGGYLYLEGTNPQTSSSKGTAASSVVRLERTSDGGYYIKMQDKYLRTPLKDKTVTMTGIPEKFYPVMKDGNQVAFTTQKGPFSALHCGYSAVIGYTLDDAASYWTVEPATELNVTGTVTKDDKFYGTLYAPFATRMGEGTTAYAVTTSDGVSTAKAFAGEVPAATPVLLRSESKTMNVDIPAADPADVEGCRVLRNDYADLSYQYFNKAFLMYSGEGKDATTYYRTNLSTTNNLYYWQQALVIIGVEDRYQFRGDRSCASLITDLLDAFIAHEGNDWNWNQFNDDLLWAGIAFVRGYNITHEQRFLDKALHAWNILYKRGYDEELGGGIWWSYSANEEHCKSGLSNNPAICMASYLYDAIGDEKYLDIAKNLYEWVYSHLRVNSGNDVGAVYEKVNPDGSRGGGFNVYNIGTFIEGCAALYKRTGDTKYRTAARQSIEYVMVSRVANNGVMSAYKEDGTWQSEFARGVAFYLDVYPRDWTRQATFTKNKAATTYYKWLRLNADAAWEMRNKELNITGCQWDIVTPNQPKEGKTWESDACVSAVVMTNVVPQYQPGSTKEEYVELDENPKAHVDDKDTELPEDAYVLDDQQIMREPAPVSIVCVGNSITEGYGLTNAMYAWPAQLQKLLGTGYEVINKGVSGTTMSKGEHGSNSPYWSQGRFTEAKNADPQILIIALGTNDANEAQDRWPTLNKTFQQDYRDMIAEFRKDGRDPVLYFVLCPPKFPLNEAWNQNIANSLLPKVRALATEFNAHVIDFNTPMLDKGSVFKDNLHPNADGAAMLGALAEQAIKKGQVLNAAITSDGSKMIAENHVMIKSGKDVKIDLTAPEEGIWKWSGPNGYTATTPSVTLSKLTRGGIYKVHFTGASGKAAAMTLCLSVEGTKAAAITPHVQIAGGGWQQTTTLKVPAGVTVNFGPQYQGSTTGIWTWEGPDGFRWVGRTPSIPDMSAAKVGHYACTYTDADGSQSTTIFTLLLQ